MRNRRSVELQIITEALRKLGPHTPAARVWGRAPGATSEQAAEGNVWAADIPDLALHICTRLYGRPGTSRETSPLAQAEDAKRARDIHGEIGALMAGDRALTTAPWHPSQAGDLVHVHHEGTALLPAAGETYIVGDIGGGLRNMTLLTHTFEEADEGGAGSFEAEACDDPIYTPWFEAGPDRLTIVRHGRVVHDGGAR